MDKWSRVPGLTEAVKTDLRLIEAGIGTVEMMQEDGVMGLTDALRAAGFKPEASTDGEWNPYKGTYKATCTVLRPETLKDTAEEVIQAEFAIVETLEGDAKRESKYADFRKRYYIHGEKGEENLKRLINDFFTWGVAFDLASDEALYASLPNAIGAEGYLRGWAWTPEGKSAQQSFVFQKEAVAAKKRGKGSATPF